MKNDATKKPVPAKKRVRTKTPSEIRKQYLDNLADFHSSECRVLLQRFEHIEKLIGVGKHCPSEGTFCEVLLRDFLRQVIPKKYSVDTGFVRGLPITISGAKGRDKDVFASPQLDIIIHDTQDFSPIFRSDDFVVVYPEAVAGVIEVKKRLTSTNLKEALQNVYETRSVISHETRLMTANRVFFGVFAFDSDIKIPKIGEASDVYQKAFKSFVRKAVDAHLLPKVIVSSGNMAIITDDGTDFSKPAVCSFYRVDQNGRANCLQVLLYLLFEKMEVAERLSYVKRFELPQSDLVLLNTIKVKHKRLKKTTGQAVPLAGTPVAAAKPAVVT